MATKVLELEGTSLVDSGRSEAEQVEKVEKVVDRGRTPTLT